MNRRDQAYVGVAGIVAVFVVVLFAGAPLFALVWLVIAGAGFVAYFRSTHPDEDQRTLPFVGNIGDLISGRGSATTDTRPPPPTGQPPRAPVATSVEGPAGAAPAEGPAFSEAEWHAQQEALRARAAAEAERRTAEREAKRAKSEARKEERKAQRDAKTKARDEARAAELTEREAAADAEKAALLERAGADPTVVMAPGGSAKAEPDTTDDRVAADARRELERLEREDAARRERERQAETERARRDEPIPTEVEPAPDTLAPTVDATVDTAVGADAEDGGPATTPVAADDEKAELLALEADLKAALAAERAAKAEAEKPSTEERARLAREVEDHRQQALAAEADLKAEEERRAAHEAAAAREVERREIEAKFAAETPSDDADILAAATESQLAPSTGEMTGGPTAVDSDGEDDAGQQKVYLLNKVRLKLSDYE